MPSQALAPIACLKVVPAFPASHRFGCSAARDIGESQASRASFKTTTYFPEMAATMPIINNRTT